MQFKDVDQRDPWDFSGNDASSTFDLTLISRLYARVTVNTIRDAAATQGGNMRAPVPEFLRERVSIERGYAIVTEHTRLSFICTRGGIKTFDMVNIARGTDVRRRVRRLKYSATESPSLG